MNKGNNKKEENAYNFSALNETAEVTETHLARLMATAAKKYVPVTTIQKDLLDLKEQPYSDMSPDKAMMELNKLLKSYDAKPKVNNFLDTTLRKSEVKISLSHVEVDGQEIIPQGGSLVALGGRDVMAREVANILMVYTSQKNEMILETIEQKTALDIKMPALGLRGIRSLINVPGSDNQETRDSIYDKLRKNRDGDKLVLMYGLTKIYSESSLLPLSKKNDKMTEWYISKCNNNKMNLNEVRIPCATSLNTFIITHAVQAWRFYCKSNMARGGRKGRGSTSYGYYRFDLPSSEVDLINEMTDVFGLCQRFGFAAVTMVTPNTNLVRLLISNGIVVYCPALTGVVQVKGRKDHKKGVFGRGYMKNFVWMAQTQASPSLSGSSVAMPAPIPLPEALSFVYEYIPDYFEKGCSYMPSIRAAEGFCIKSNIKGLKFEEEITADNLRGRFSQAVFFRNWFIFSRVTFVSQDRYRNFFLYPWTYPKIVSDKIEDLFSTAVESKVKVKPETKIFTVMEESIAMSSDIDYKVAEKDLRSLLVEMNLQTLSGIYRDLQTENFVIPEVLRTSYAIFPPSEFERILVEFIPDIKRPEESTIEIIQNTPTISDDEQKEDDDLFSGALPAEAKLKQITSGIKNDTEDNNDKQDH
jgi:hypothetical protein